MQISHLFSIGPYLDLNRFVQEEQLPALAMLAAASDHLKWLPTRESNN
jgi:hypothetical protein